MNIFNYGTRKKFAAGVSGDTAVTRLRNRVNKLDIATSISSSVSESKLVGEVADHSVVLHRVRPFVWNLFKPHFYGNFQKDGDHVVLDGIFSVSSAAKIIFSAFLVVLALAELVFLFGTPDGTQAQIPIPSSVFVLGIAAALIGFLLISKWFFKSDVQWITDEIKKALAGNGRMGSGTTT
jgi:hypothetical protein